MNPETLPRHELAGLHVEVIDASSDDYVGIAGEVIDETHNTLVVREGPASNKQVPKATATFSFTLPDGDVVIVEGARLVADPARRTETTGDNKWR